jgi:hypothetical protein
MNIKMNSWIVEIPSETAIILRIDESIDLFPTINLFDWIFLQNINNIIEPNI